jgi:NitT/TauT family transport system permease protein
VVVLSKHLEKDNSKENNTVANGNRNDKLELSDSEVKNQSDPQKENRLVYFFKENSFGKYLFKIGRTMFPFIVLGIIAEILAVILNATVPSTINSFPPPHKMISYAWNSLFPGPDSPFTSLWIHIGSSFLKVLIGFLIGALSGILVGILMGINKWIFRLLNPLFSLMISIPTLAWVPIILVIFGLTLKTILITIALSCFFPMVYSTTNGIRSIDKKFIWAAKIMGATKIEIFFDVLLPGSLVSIVAGLRLAIGYSWRAIVGAEILVSLTDASGLGIYIVGGQTSNLAVQVLVGIFMIAFGGLLLDAILMQPLEKITISRWGLIQEGGTIGST